MNSIEKLLDEIVQDLPIIRPIREFVHLNLLMPYQGQNFWKAIHSVGIKFDSHPLPSLRFFQKLLKQQKISAQVLEVINNHYTPASLRSKVMATLQTHDQEFYHTDIRLGPLHAQWNDYLQVNIVSLADGLLIKWLSMFLDQGIATWPMPGSDQSSFYNVIKDLISNSWSKVHPFTARNVKTLFLPTPEAAIQEHLRYLCPNEELQPNYLKESVMALRGWAGLVHSIQVNPELLSFQRKISVMDFIAVKLVLERAWIEAELNGRSAITKLEESEKNLTHVFDDSLYFQSLKIAQIALEETNYQKLKNSFSNEINNSSKKSPTIQIIFCIDDREEKLRKDIEEVSSEIETFSLAGHFGIEAMYSHPKTKFLLKHCPAPAIPKVLLVDQWKQKRKNDRRIQVARYPVKILLRKWKELKDLYYLSKKLIFNSQSMSVKNVLEVKLPYYLQLDRADESARIDNNIDIPSGYTISEMAQVAFEQLNILGLVKNPIAKLVLFVGHGGTSENNPYFNAYGCGACSGRSGSMNARAIVGILNHPLVRTLLGNQFQLHIPSHTIFVAAYHDTTRDQVEIFHEQDLTVEQRAMLVKVKKYFSVCLAKNAKRRATHFPMVKFLRTGLEAQHEVFRRSSSFFETRPELGHTDVAFALVGSRAFTNRPKDHHVAFLQSYEAIQDLEGSVLASILRAVVPVCSGINLDYYFSRTDNTRLGAGSKLPQNVFGNIGLSHGTESDLLFGLPIQMVDQHHPMRLMIMIEQRPEIVLKALSLIGKAVDILDHQWSHLTCFDSDHNKWYRYDLKSFQEWGNDGI
jgi:uncharacterized protein YbcC (UPF0753/DUF2309 family)